MEAAMTGHPVYTTLHSNSVAETIRRLVVTFPAEERQGRTIDIMENHSFGSLLNDWCLRLMVNGWR